MAFDQTTRNRLARFVSDTRSLLAEEFTRQLQNDYGLDPNSGDVTDLARLEHLDDARRETARLLRDTMEHYLASADTATPAKAKKARQDVLDRIVREQAFTILNRLCALRMAEARGLLIESIAKGYQSKGFQLYQRLAGTALGETGACYRLFIFSVFDEFAADLPVLFDRFSPQGRLFPREAALLSVLQEINHSDIDPLWAEDETIGWIYQYFNSVEERRQMRAASQAPRNSRELAVRNQFFTPRYVVEFLTDNTLGRIWYEMTKGESSLKESCRYLVRRPNETFLAEGEAVPEQDDTGEELSQEELLKQPVHILHRPLKDPRDIKMLDPACGSMHFGLYAFDLFERIYEEAWEIEAQRGADGFARTEELKPLHESYTDKDAFLRDVPRLIIERNIHGIDIDSRAVQIAGLSLWLRAQRSWQVQNVKALDRPQIQRSNIVCAEPMPGEADMLEEFTEQLQPKVLGQLVKIIFEKMKLAGEAGSLLKIEEEIKDAVSTAHEAYQKYLLEQQKDSEYLPGMAPKREATLFDFAGLPEEDDFWNSIELRVIDALRNYAEQAESGAFQRRLFAKDAAQGFAFIDICRKRYDVVLMNPPFGSPTHEVSSYINRAYKDHNHDIINNFIERAISISADSRSCGVILSRTILLNERVTDFRKETLLKLNSISYLVDLGGGVLDAAVDTAMMIFKNYERKSWVQCADCLRVESAAKHSAVLAFAEGHYRKSYQLYSSDFELIPLAVFCYWIPRWALNLFSKNKIDPSYGTIRKGLITGDDFRFARNRSEINATMYSCWPPLFKGGEFSTFYSPIDMAVNWKSNGYELHAYATAKYGTASRTLKNTDYIGRQSLGWGIKNSIGFGVKIIDERFIVYNDNGPALFLNDEYLSEDRKYGLLAFLNSSLCRLLLRVFQVGERGRYQWLSAYVQFLPVPDGKIEEISAYGKQLTNLFREIFSLFEEYPGFELEYFSSFSLKVLSTDGVCSEQVDRQSAEIRDSYALIEQRVPELFGVSESEINELSSHLLDGRETPMATHARIVAQLESSIVERVISMIIGYEFNRWHCQKNSIDIMDLTSVYQAVSKWLERQGDEVIHGFHTSLRRCKGGVQLGQYLANPNGFFADHIGMYSSNKRKAPIYWPLSSTSSSYTLWLYYHRLTDQTLYTCVNDFVDPKLKQVSDDVTSLRNKSSRSSAEEKELERLSDLELELKDFRDELLRIARFWKPNLNDGVQITAAPLWNLFQHRQWKARLKETWEKLEAGDYDWAHLALSIWPDRVIRASHKDRSYAIAHDLEDQLWHEVEVEKVGRGGRVTTATEWQPRDLSSADLQRIITEVKAR